VPPFFNVFERSTRKQRDAPTAPGRYSRGVVDPVSTPAALRSMRAPIPARVPVGFLLVAGAWILSWGLSGQRTHALFFPLWLGYCLVIDGWTRARTGTSPLSRSARGWALLFLGSIPVWWLFELLNLRLGNWEYLGSGTFSQLEYAFWCSVSFSTVMPAVLGTSELVRSFSWIERFAAGPRLQPTPRFLIGCSVAGAAMLALLLVWPRLFYVFCWTSLVFLLEPLVYRRRRGSFLQHLERGDWRPWMSLWTAGLVCGFLWELWNLYSWPKWIYHIPGVGFWKVFEMPLLGYLGYLPFAMELYLLARLALPTDARPRLEAEERRALVPGPLTTGVGSR